MKNSVSFRFGKVLTVALLVLAMTLSLVSCTKDAPSPNSGNSFQEGTSSNNNNNNDNKKNPTPNTDSNDSSAKNAIKNKIKQNNSKSDPDSDDDSSANNGGNSTNSGGNSAPTKQLVSEPINDIDYSTTANSKYIQDFYAYCEAELSIKKQNESGEYIVQDFDGTADDLDIIKAYVNTLCNGSYNLKKVADYEESYNNGSTFFSWGIDYTGGASINAKTDVTYTNQKANIMLFGMIERNKLTLAIWIPQRMEIVDMGLRCSGNNGTVSLGGKSATAGLYLLSDGTYETDDGRLGAAVGTATVLCDGTAYSASTEYVRNERSSRDELWVRSFYRDNGFYFCTPIDRIQTGDVFTLSNLTRTETWVNRGNKEFNSLDDFAGYNFTQFFGAAHDGFFITPLMGTNSMFEDLTVRIMYYKRGVVCVYYVYAKFTDAPYEYEALCVLNLAEDRYTGADYEYSISTNQELELTVNRYFGANTEEFAWEIIEGADIITLTNTKSAICTVTPIGKGVARVRVKYEYSYDEPDVLTGIKGYGFSTRTYDYYIEIK